MITGVVKQNIVLEKAYGAEIEKQKASREMSIGGVSVSPPPSAMSSPSVVRGKAPAENRLWCILCLNEHILIC